MKRHDFSAPFKTNPFNAVWMIYLSPFVGAFLIYAGLRETVGVVSQVFVTTVGIGLFFASLWLIHVITFVDERDTKDDH